MYNLALTYWRQGRWKEAEELFVQVVETQKKVLGAEHPDTLVTMHNLASTYRSQERWKEAEELFAIPLMENCFQLRKQVLRAQHPHVELSREALSKWAGT
ncbi:hypothetical protein K469DRAFT_587897 [Zopfia rhizophila CBS 207.26]|uniref:Uncharacterized protein n=1 Tax=Zopfia rhizophila CBS 207.26 TaxID=1314779 RepID=A0A6A6DRC8_9PEZI|nr:hypothetical protein K469DRAFT_587897 [Zopfia rhizophila CBS 207.26]